MIREKVTYENIFAEKITKDLIFHISLYGLKVYEMENQTRFYDDWSEVVTHFFKLLKNSNYQKYINENENNHDIENQLELLPILNDAKINNFIIKFIKSFYAQIIDGKIVQDESTIDYVENSLWSIELLNINFFMKIFNELNKNKPQSKKK